METLDTVAGNKLGLQTDRPSTTSNIQQTTFSKTK